MRITRVSYRALINLGNYSNESIELSAQLEEGDTPETVVPALREKTYSVAENNIDSLYNERRNLKKELTDLERKVQKARDEWTRTAEFLRAQGIKADAPDFPLLTNLLPEVQGENVEIVDAEISDSDADDDDDEAGPF